LAEEREVEELEGLQQEEGLEEDESKVNYGEGEEEGEF
jgi:hypothetical protein